MTGEFFAGRFANKTIVITGGGTGMGRAAALRMGREGANVVIAGRRLDKLTKVATEITDAGGIATAVQTDVANPLDVETLMDTAIDKYGSIDLAWNNAGILGAFKPLSELEYEEFDALMNTNLRGVFSCLKYQILAMQKSKNSGAIVNTSSWTAHGAMPGTAAYAATKGALDALTRCLAVELGSSNIRINNVSPGIIMTPMGVAALPDENTQRQLVEHTPANRLGTSEDVADTVLWLLSNDARFITGESIMVDGGFTIGGPRL